SSMDAGHSGSARQPEQTPHTEPYHAPAMHSDELQVVVPNSPSSPVWSLIDHRTRDEDAEMAQAAANLQETPVTSRSPGDDAAREVGHALPEAALTAEVPEQGPRATRKGWWQRRFKP